MCWLFPDIYVFNCTHIRGGSLIGPWTGEGDKLMTALVDHKTANCVGTRKKMENIWLEIGKININSGTLVITYYRHFLRSRWLLLGQWRQCSGYFAFIIFIFNARWHHHINQLSTGNVPQRQLQMAAGGPPADSLLRESHHGVAENTFVQIFSQI